jgi:hypothetical protein
MSDGAYVRVSSTSRVYRIAGGAALRITDCKPLAGCPGAVNVNQIAINRLEHGHGMPRDGTFLRVTEAGSIYEVVGGAPLRIARFKLFAGWRNFIAVNQSTINTLRHLRAFPVDETYLRTADTLRAYKVTGGKLLQFNYCVIPGCGITPNIDQNAVDRLIQVESVATRGTVTGDFLILITVGLALAALTILAAKWPLVAVSALLAIFVLVQAVWREFDPLLRIEHAYPGRFSGGFTIYSYDVVAVAFLIVAGYRLITRGLQGREQGLVFLLALLTAIHVARGMFAFDFQSAVNQGRPILYFLAPLAYAASVPRGWDKRVWRPFALTCFLLITVAAFFYLRYGFQSNSEVIMSNGTEIISRPIVGVGGLLIVEVAAILSVLRWPSRRSGVVLAIILGIGVFALQLRTIWAIGLAIGIIAFFGWSSNRFRESRMLVTRAVVGAFLVIALAALGFLKSNTLLTDIKSATQSSGTFGWRITGWKELLAKHHSIKEIVTGIPSGSPWTRTINGVTTDVLPHNFYVELFLRFGALGVLILLALYFLLWRHRAEIAPKLGLTPMVIGLLLFAQLMYFVSLSPDLVQGLILGILIGALPPTALWQSRQIAGKKPESETDRLANAR